jgi:hypothetical protein
MLLAGVVLAATLSFTASPAAPAAPISSPHDDKLAAAVVKWFTHGGDKRITALQHDFELIAKSAEATDLPGVKTNCTTLGTDVDKAQDYSPLPDGEAQLHWAAALDMYAHAAGDCVKGAEAIDSGLLLKANDEMSQGSVELTKATARVEDILN